jgi:hypothetical protein
MWCHRIFIIAALYITAMQLLHTFLTVAIKRTASSPSIKSSSLSRSRGFAVSRSRSLSSPINLNFNFCIRERERDERRDVMVHKLSIVCVIFMRRSCVRDGWMDSFQLESRFRFLLRTVSNRMHAIALNHQRIGECGGECPLAAMARI